LGVTHAERELGFQAKTFARKKTTLFQDLDAALDEYVKNRAFFITGVAKGEILDKVKGLLTEVAKAGQPVPTIETDIRTLLADFLPTRDSAGRLINTAARVSTIVRTNVMDIYNQARMMMFNSPAMRDWVQAWKYSAVMDSRTTQLCRTLHGYIFTRETIDGFNPPNHFNCRSILIPITTYDEGWQYLLDFQRTLGQDISPDEGFD